MSKPLSETHPTLQKKFIETGWILEDEEWDINYEELLNEVQYCTVDVAEHERVKKEYDEFKDKAYSEHQDNLLEVERLKKELVLAKSAIIHHGIKDAKETECEFCHRHGVAEGERRAMNKAADVFADIFDEYVDTTRHHRFLQRLGLGEDKTFNPATDHHNCSAGTCAACGHFDSDISFEEEDSDNNNYTNKGEE